MSGLGRKALPFLCGALLGATIVSSVLLIVFPASSARQYYSIFRQAVFKSNTTQFAFGGGKGFTAPSSSSSSSTSSSSSSSSFNAAASSTLGPGRHNCDGLSGIAQLDCLDKLRLNSKYQDPFNCSCRALENTKSLSTNLEQCLRHAGELEDAANTEQVGAHVIWDNSPTSGKFSLCTGDGLSEATVGVRAYFHVHAYSNTSRRTTGHDEYWWARLVTDTKVKRDMIYYAVDFVDFGNGTYEGSYTVMEGGQYKLEITYVDDHPLGSPFTVMVRGDKGGVVKKYPPSPLPPLSIDEKEKKKKKDKKDDGKNNNNKEKEKENEDTNNNNSNNSKELVGCTHLSQLERGRWYDTEWKPLVCDLPDHDREVLRNKRIFFAGDSLARATYFTFVAWMLGRVNGTHFNGHHHAYWTAYNPDLNCTAHYVTFWDSNTLSTLEWHGGSEEGIRLFPLEGLNYFDAVVLYVGTHDLKGGMGSRKRPTRDTLNIFTHNLAKTVSRVREKWGFTGELLWMTSTAAVPSKLTGDVFVHYKMYQNYRRVQVFNAAAKGVMESLGVKVIDPYRFSLPRPEYSYDGQHYVAHANPAKDSVYVVIRRAIVHFLFYLPPRIHW